MKFIFSSLVMIVGIFIILVGIFIPTFSIAQTSQTISYTNSFAPDLSLSYPYSTNPSSPTIFSNPNSTTITAWWAGYNTSSAPGWGPGKNGVVYVDVYQGSTLVETLVKKNVYWSLTTGEGGDFLLYARIPFENPYPNQSILLTFVIWGSIDTTTQLDTNPPTDSYANWVTADIHITLQKYTVYGEFPLPKMWNIGHEYVQIGSSNIEKISISDQLYNYSISAWNVTQNLKVWYVEDQGTTPYLSIAILYLKAKLPNNQQVILNLSMQPVSFTYNNQTYPAFEASYVINASQSFVAEVILTSQFGQQLSLPKILGNPSSMEPSTIVVNSTIPHIVKENTYILSYGQIETIAIGSVVFVVGAVVGWRWHI